MTAQDKFRRVQRQLSYVFLALLVAGSIATFIYKWLPVMAVVFYAGIGWFLTKEQKNSEKFADSLYYLGFLLTLVSLLAATLDPATATDSIISNLGTGLSTTLVGLALRVVVIQFRDTVSDQEEEAKQSLHDAVFETTTAFRDLTSTIQGFRKSTADAGNDTLETIRKGQRDLAVTLKTINELHLDSERVVGSAVEGLRRQLAAISVPPDLVEAHVKAMLSPLGEAVRSVTGDLSVAGQELSGRIGRSGADTEQACKQLVAGFAPLGATLKNLQTEFGQAKIGLADLADDAKSAFQARLDALDLTKIQSAHGAAAEFILSLEKQVNVFGAACSELQRLALSASASAERFQRTIDENAASAERLAAATKHIVSTNALAIAVDARIKTLDDSVEGVRASTVKLVSKADDAEAEIGRVKNHIGEVRDATKALISFVSQQP